MTNSFFKKSIFISLLGHITAFSIFGLSFGHKIPMADYNGVSFWGAFLSSAQVTGPVVMEKGEKGEKGDGSIFSEFRNGLKNRTVPGFSPVFPGAIKPYPSFALNMEKEAFIDRPLASWVPAHRSTPAIIFHPVLPYGFSLYFKDRQCAHVELKFKTFSSGVRNPILVQRKISSGNLEVDLLSIRYISHYLFVQHANLAPGNWQTVKIDLSAKEEMQ